MSSRQLYLAPSYKKADEVAHDLRCDEPRSGGEPDDQSNAEPEREKKGEGSRSQWYARSGLSVLLQVVHQTIHPLPEPLHSFTTAVGRPFRLDEPSVKVEQHSLQYALLTVGREGALVGDDLQVQVVPCTEHSSHLALIGQDWRKGSGKLVQVDEADFGVSTIPSQYERLRGTH